MSGLPQVDKVKTHFVSGEPGTTGREPFDESISSGKFLPDHLMGKTDSAPHIPLGSHAGAGIGGHDHGLGSHSTHSHSTNDQMHPTTGTGLTGNPGAGARSADIQGGTGTGVGASHSGSHGAHASTTHGDDGKKGVVEKVKEKVGLDKDPSTNNPKSSSTTHDNTHNARDHSSTHNRDHGVATGTGAGLATGAAHGTHGTHGTAHNSTDTNASYNRDVVDKINDTLPGTPAKVPQAYQAGDHSTGVTGTEYGAGKHAGSGEGIHSGVGGVVSGGHGVAGTAHDDRMVDRTPESVDHKKDGLSKGGIDGVMGTSDKDFLSRDRKGEGAYADTHGVTEVNSSGPKGNPALTGREGNAAENPVAQRHGVDAHDSTTGTGEKKGLMQKIKDIL